MRYTPKRKAELVALAKAGLPVCKDHNISPEELKIWEEALEKHGVRGLRTTRLQEYRSRENG